MNYSIKINNNKGSTLFYQSREGFYPIFEKNIGRNSFSEVSFINEFENYPNLKRNYKLSFYGNNYIDFSHCLYAINPSYNHYISFPYLKHNNNFALLLNTNLDDGTYTEDIASVRVFSRMSKRNIKDNIIPLEYSVVDSTYKISTKFTVYDAITLNIYETTDIVIDSLNKYILWSEIVSGVTSYYMGTLIEGTYSIASFVTELETQLNTSGVSKTVAYSGGQVIVTISSGNFYFKGFNYNTIPINNVEITKTTYSGYNINANRYITFNKGIPPIIIDSTNNKIDIREAVPWTNYTATLTNGTYTLSTFVTELNSKISVLGSNNLTATLNADNTITFAIAFGYGTQILWESGVNSNNNCWKYCGVNYPKIDTRTITVGTPLTTNVVDYGESVDLKYNLYFPSMNKFILLWNGERFTYVDGRINFSLYLDLNSTYSYPLTGVYINTPNDGQVLYTDVINPLYKDIIELHVDATDTSNVSFTLWYYPTPFDEIVSYVLAENVDCSYSTTDKYIKYFNLTGNFSNISLYYDSEEINSSLMLKDSLGKIVYKNDICDFTILDKIPFTIGSTITDYVDIDHSPYIEPYFLINDTSSILVNLSGNYHLYKLMIKRLTSTSVRIAWCKFYTTNIAPTPITGIPNRSPYTLYIIKR